MIQDELKLIYDTYRGKSIGYLADTLEDLLPEIAQILHDDQELFKEMKDEVDCMQKQYIYGDKYDEYHGMVIESCMEVLKKVLDKISN